MLQPIEQLIPDPFMRLFAAYDAIDTTTGATLSRTNGRGKGGLPKYVLILPDAPPAANTVWTQYRRGEWSDGNRKVIRAWTFAEALQIAEQRLKKMGLPAAAVARGDAGDE